jgi:hypothetical protein
MENKIPLLVGFLSRALTPAAKLRFYKKFQSFFALMVENIKNNVNYKTNINMFTCFINNWNANSKDKQEIKNNA